MFILIKSLRMLALNINTTVTDEKTKYNKLFKKYLPISKFNKNSPVISLCKPMTIFSWKDWGKCEMSLDNPYFLCIGICELNLMYGWNLITMKSFRFMIWPQFTSGKNIILNFNKKSKADRMSQDSHLCVKRWVL